MPDAAAPWRLVLCAEATLWSALVVGFLIQYVNVFNGPTQAIVPHLSLVASALLGLVSLRALSWYLLGGSRAARWAAALLMTLPWLVLALWYALMLLGLSSWGRVTTWPLIRTYAAQSGALLDTLGIAAWIAYPIIILALTLPLLLAWRFLAPRDWVRSATRVATPAVALLVLVLLTAISALQVFRFAQYPPVAVEEPISLSLFPHVGLKLKQSHHFGSRVLDAAEDEARNAYSPAPPRRRPNVILIVGDALRSDHLSLHGYSRDTTPYLKQLVGSGLATSVQPTRAACAESSCGLLALAASRPVHALPTSPLTLHEVLRRNGYRVHLVLGGDHTHFYGLKDAYGPVDSYFDGSEQTLRYMNDDRLVLDHASQLPVDDPLQPAMFQFHLMSTHALGLRSSETGPYAPVANYYRWPRGVRPTGRDVAGAVNYYDNGMVQFDHTVRLLLQTLQRKGYLEQAIVVVTGDHGEMLGEHGQVGHASNVFEGSLDIPLIISRRGYSGQPLLPRPLVAQIDIAPTILDDLRLPIPSTWWGIPLQRPAEPRLVHFQQGSIAGFYDLTQPPGILKYWKDYATGSEAAFDLLDNPKELENRVHNVDPAKLRRWRRAMIPAAASGGHISQD